MRRWAAAIIIIIFSVAFIACGRDKASVTNTAPYANLNEPEQQRATVSVLPPANADQLRPGVFVLTVKRPDATAPHIETAELFTLQETIYDANGHEAGASVPSTTWPFLDEASRAQLAGMRVGEIRRFWTCSDRFSERCKVEDVELLSVQVNGAPQNAPKPVTNTASSNGSVAEPMPVGGDVTAPVVVTRVEPKWPEQVTKQRTWLYSLVVTKAGRVKDVRLMQGESGMYSALIEEALLKWRFKPGTYRGRPVDVRYNITITIHVR